MLTFNMKDPGSYSDFLCGLQWAVNYYCPQFNAWILMYMSGERTIAVFWALRAKQYLRRRNIFVVLVTTAVLLFGLNIHFWITEEVQGSEHNKYCYYKPEYQHFGSYIWPWIDFVVMSLVPFLVILILNICIIVKMAIVYYNRRINMNVATDSAAFANMTIILLAVCTWFFLTTAPKATFIISEGVGGLYTVSRTPEDQAWFGLAMSIVNIVAYLNNTFNFALYIVTSSKFRKELANLFSCGRNDKKYASSTSLVSISHVSAM